MISGDLLNASTSASRPVYPQYWQPSYSILAPTSWDWSSTTMNTDSGSGFFSKMFDLLPSKSLACVVRLSKLNHVLSSPPTAPPDKSFMVSMLNTTLALHHQLLSLSAWNKLDPADQAGPERLYDICRLAALIYCNAVLLAVPPHRHWHVKLSERLYSMLDDHYTNSEPGAEAEFLIWALCVGSLAVSHGPSRDRYEVFLRHLMSKQKIQQQEHLEQLLARYLWSDRACGPGLTTLWLSLG